MTVSMGITHGDSGEYEVVPIATSATFREVWLPACERLGLEMVELFYGGAFACVPPSFLPRIVSELETLRDWAASEPDLEYVADRCAGLLAAFARTDPAGCDYDIG